MADKVISNYIPQSSGTPEVENFDDYTLFFPKTGIRFKSWRQVAQ